MLELNFKFQPIWKARLYIQLQLNSWTYCMEYGHFYVISFGLHNFFYLFIIYLFWLAYYKTEVNWVKALPSNYF